MKTLAWATHRQRAGSTAWLSISLTGNLIGALGVSEQGSETIYPQDNGGKKERNVYTEQPDRKRRLFQQQHLRLSAFTYFEPVLFEDHFRPMMKTKDSLSAFHAWLQPYCFETFYVNKDARKAPNEQLVLETGVP